MLMEINEWKGRKDNELGLSNDSNVTNLSFILVDIFISEDDWRLTLTKIFEEIASANVINLFYLNPFTLETISYVIPLRGDKWRARESKNIQFRQTHWIQKKENIRLKF